MRVLTGAILLAGALAIGGCSEQEADEAAAGSQACASDDSGITLPPGFCATVFAEDVGRGRHLVVGADGTVYLNTWSGFYYDGDVRRDEGYLVALKDTSGDGKADIVTRFGPGTGDKVAGGTGIAIYKGWLYAEVDDRIIRWHLNPGGAAPKSAPDVIVSGLPMGGEHPMHQFVIDGAGQLFVPHAIRCLQRLARAQLNDVRRLAARHVDSQQLPAPERIHIDISVRRHRDAVGAAILVFKQWTFDQKLQSFAIGGDLEYSRLRRVRHIKRSVGSRRDIVAFGRLARKCIPRAGLPRRKVEADDSAAPVRSSRQSISAKIVQACP